MGTSPSQDETERSLLLPTVFPAFAPVVSARPDGGAAGGVATREGGVDAPDPTEPETPPQRSPRRQGNERLRGADFVGRLNPNDLPRVGAGGRRTTRLSRGIRL